MAEINPAATLIPDEAEVWLAMRADVDDIADLIPSDATDDLEALGWEFSGLIDDVKGIPLGPSVEVRPYNAFGYPRFRVKLNRGFMTSGFTVLETNTVTEKVVLPGSEPGKIGIPKDTQVYVLYRFVDEDVTRCWVSLTPAPVEVAAHGGIVDGELSFADLVIHHTANADGDVFQVVESTPVVQQMSAPLGGGTGGASGSSGSSGATG